MSAESAELIVVIPSKFGLSTELTNRYFQMTFCSYKSTREFTLTGRIGQLGRYTPAKNHVDRRRSNC